MSVSSVNGYSAPQVQESKKAVDQEQAKEIDYSKALEQVKKMNDKFVHKSDIKTPGQVVASVGYASAKTFLNAAATFTIFDGLFKGGVSKFLKDSVKKGLGLIGKVVTKLEQGATSKIKDGAIKVLKGIQTKVPEIAKKVKLPFLAGVLAVGTMVPAICSRDNNDDGIKDIAQKSQSAYDNFEKKSNGLISGANEVAQLMQILS